MYTQRMIYLINPYDILQRYQHYIFKLIILKSYFSTYSE